ncbi:MAG TPA: NAD(P)-dependent oxidoreductase [Xanthobacteraceae bacterium]|jgi:3-hydroxyisobutyrate dehydrogenase-like beta-hydroxyacid dehydrogenase|nr:NAD(P)-dependent oxidoreductase [Xanthobacteraceae bacterium]
MEIGFIGAGRMGFHMVRRLIEAGHTVIVADNSADAIARAKKVGAQTAASTKEVADRVETVMASLPTPNIVLAVANEVAEGKKIRRFIDLSTTGASMAARTAEILKKHSIAQIDSPVSGGVGGAEKGTLAVMVSGPKADIDVAEPALSVIGKVFRIGERAGAAQTMKLINNYLSATAMAATAEAMVMGVKAGLDPKLMLDVINAGSGRNTASMDKYPRAIITRTFDFGFATALMLKDVKLCLDEAAALGVPNDIMSAVGRLWQTTQDEIGPDTDFTTVVQPLERRAGVEVKAK